MGSSAPNTPLARERGFSALVAWSRGGSTQDHYADVYYLTGFYTHQPFIPAEPGRRLYGLASPGATSWLLRIWGATTSGFFLLSKSNHKNGRSINNRNIPGCASIGVPR